MADSAGIHLGAGRRYDWAGQVLPAEIQARHHRIAESMRVAIRSSGVEAPITVTRSEVLDASAHGVAILTTGIALGSLRIETRTTVEYDGLGVVDVLLTPGPPVAIDRVDLQVAVVRTPDMQVLGFDPKNVYWSGAERFLSPCYRGAYKNIVGFIARDTGLWWLADESDEWAVGPSPVTEIHCSPATLELAQPVIASPRVLREPFRFRFAFLATPVRDLPADIRANRVVAVLSRDEARVGNLNLWWPAATAHYALPYLDYPPGSRERLSRADINAYPGVARNRTSLRQWRDVGIDRLPYVSLRAISPLDDLAQGHLADWQVQPLRRTDLAVDAPYKTAFERPLVSLRASGYVDYELARLDEIADRLGVRGFYFDQAEPIGSANPAYVSRGVAGSVRPATDVLAMRDFFRRLATMLVAKGRKPLIYVHNSTAPVIPAYTFVTGMVQGEELNLVLRNFDYQASVPIDHVWPLYAAQHSGVPTVWLEELWSDVLAAQRPPQYRTDLRAWLGSDDYYSAWRNFMALALVHDIPVLSNVPVRYREALYSQLDRFGVSRSEFLGYWQMNRDWHQDPVLVSAYVRQSDPALLAVVANVTSEAKVMSPAELVGRLGVAELPETLRPALAHYRSTGRTIEIPARDFVLVELR